MGKFGWAILLASMALCGCASRDQVMSEKAGEKVVSMEAGDPAMEAAVAEARRTLDDFIRKLATPQPDADYMVKAPFPTDDGNVEHMWIGALKYTDQGFTGKLANQPASIKAMKMGDELTVKRSDVTDWVILTPSGQEGGFSQKVLEQQAGK
jgi:uncharacterized protein YegJ (DUF2314 family)